MVRRFLGGGVGDEGGRASVRLRTGCVIVTFTRFRSGQLSSRKERHARGGERGGDRGGR